MAGTSKVFLHIGAPKTGTSFLQGVLLQNRGALQRDGLLVPGSARYGHVAEALDLRDMSFKGYRNPAVKGAWNRSLEQIRAFDGSAILDQELLSGANQEQIDRALSDLGFAEIHVVYTARDMARQLAAAWQEWIKNRESTTYADFLASVRDPDGPEPRTRNAFRRLYDTPTVLARWTRDVPPDRVHVVTVPPAGVAPDTLWQRFAEVLGVDPGRYDTNTTRTNASLGAAEATVLRRVNVELGEATFPWKSYDRLVKQGVARALGTRKGDKIDLPQDAFEWAVDWSQQTAKYLADAGFAIVGDLDELIPRERPRGTDPDKAPYDQQAAAAITGVAAAVQMQTAGNDETERHIADLRKQLDAAVATLREHRELTPRQRVRRCVKELSQQVRWLGALSAGRRRIRGAAHRDH